ncbi:glycosyltransferase family 2 protein [Mesorhizobium atlanticum]
MQPDVSFVIAAYNAETTLDRAIAGAIAQLGVTVEVIVVDDQSRDGTLGVARAYPEDIVKVVALPENRGPGGARNAGLDFARGRWVAVLDSDDAVLPGRMAAMIARAEAAGAEIAVDNVRGRARGRHARRHHVPGRLSRSFARNLAGRLHRRQSGFRIALQSRLSQAGLPAAVPRREPAALRREAAHR